MQIYKDPTDEVSPFLAEKYDRDAARYWDRFYKRNGANFFKDRHYLEEEFPMLCEKNIVLLEVGCGAGNTVYPLVARHPDMRVFACDFSPNAVELVNTHEQYDPERVTAFVADITEAYPFDVAVQPGSIDIVTMVFVLSAITPEKMQMAISNIAHVLKPGGRVLLRDYAKGDLAQVRLGQEGKQQRISKDFYVRGDGTCAYYFSEEELCQIFEMHGLKCVKVEVHERQLSNRKKEQVMDRKWIQAVFQRREGITRSTLSPSAVKFSGAAGRLATGRPSNSLAVLPDSLDPADIIAGEISIACPGSVAAYEAELEREFADMVNRDTEEVVAEEIALMALRGKDKQGVTVLAGMEYEAHRPDQNMTEDDEGRQPKFWGLNPDTLCDKVAGADLGMLEVAVAGCTFRLDSGQQRSGFQDHPQVGVTVLGADPVLARFVAMNPGMFQGKRVLHLWCGELPICAMMALKTCRKAVAAVKSSSQLPALRTNARLNSANFIFERLQCCDAMGLICTPPSSSSAKSKVTQGLGAFEVIMCSWDALSNQKDAKSAANKVMEAASPLLSKGAVIILALLQQSKEHLPMIESACKEAGFVISICAAENEGLGWSKLDKPEQFSHGSCVMCLSAQGLSF